MSSRITEYEKRYIVDARSQEPPISWRIIGKELGRSPHNLCSAYKRGFPTACKYMCKNCGGPTNSERRLCHQPKCRAVYNREYQRDRRTEFVYDLTTDDIHQILEEQNYTCLLCPAKIDFTTRHIDHDHKTGKFRGLLCNTCNRGLGYFGDDSERLRAAAKYLEQHYEYNN